MASYTGSPVTVDAAANSGSQSITVPSDATAVAVFWPAAWRTSASLSMSSMTLGGSGLTLAQNVAQGTDAPACGVGYISAPATGSQTLAWDWSGTDDVEEGGRLVVAFLKDTPTSSAVADSDAVASESAGPTTESVTLSTDGTEFCIGVISSYQPTTPNGAPTSSDQTVDLNDSLYNNYYQDLFHKNTTTTPTTGMSGTGSYAALAAIAFKTAGGGGGSPLRRNSQLDGLGASGPFFHNPLG